MAKTIKVTVELEYYREDTEFGIGREFESDDEFLEYVKDSAHEDIWHLVLGNDVDSWATIEVVE